MHQNVNCGSGGAGGWGAGGWGAHRIVHKIEENQNFWNGCLAKNTRWKTFKPCTFN